MKYPKYNDRQMSNENWEGKPVCENMSENEECECPLQEIVISNVMDICGSDEDYSENLKCVSNSYSMSWPKNPELARAYVPFQTINKLYQPAEGLDKGSIFPELSN